MTGFAKSTGGHVSFSGKGEWLGDRVGKAIGQAGARGVNKALERLKSLSVPLAPLDRGPLRESATVEPASEFLTAGEMSGALIFDTPYAAAQHERLDFAHDDGQAKYVEQPLTEHGAELHAIIAKEIRNDITA